jgi:lysozyme
MVDPALAIAVALIGPDEAFIPAPYHGEADRPGVWSIGYGFITNEDGSPVTPDTPPMTKAQGDARLATLAESVLAAVRGMVHVPISNNAAAALTSFAYNLGTNALRTSTLLLRLNQGDIAGAAECFPAWVYSDGKMVPGLVERRKQECALFLKPDAPSPAFHVDPTQQEITPADETDRLNEESLAGTLPTTNPEPAGSPAS